MRWIWIDRIVELDRAARCVAVKCVSAAEEVLHDHFPARESTDPQGRPVRTPPVPVLPNPLIIEGMAQTAGILVGHAGDFREKVILAKIAKARFTAAAHPGHVLRYTATLERFDEQGASARGEVTRLDPASGGEAPLAEIELMFSHIDRNRAGAMFPAENFVFTDQFFDLLRRAGVAVPDR